MSEKLMIIVTGAPATGKTTLSRNLAERFKFPVINKDETKELIFNNLEIKGKDWKVKIDITSLQLTLLLTEKLAQTGKIFIIEGNFENKYSRESFLDIKSRYNYKMLQLFCHTQEETLYERYIRRDNSGERHPVHTRLTGGFEEYKKMNDKNFKLDIGGSINIDIDTTKFENVNLHEIYDEVERNIKFVD